MHVDARDREAAVEAMAQELEHPVVEAREAIRLVDGKNYASLLATEDLAHVAARGKAALEVAGVHHGHAERVVQLHQLLHQGY